MNRDRHSELEPVSKSNGRLSGKFIQYPSQQEAFSFLERVLADPNGLGLLHGPDVAGKSALIEQIAHKMRERAAVAVVDGSHLRPAAFLAAILTEFGYEPELSSIEELLSVVSVFGVEQARAQEAPVLVLEHFNHMLPGTLDVLCKLAMLTVDNRFALRIILVGDRYFRRVIDAPEMMPVATRLAGDFEMRPLTASESLVYLFAGMKANGVSNPDKAFSTDICSALHLSTQGWPGNIDRVADSAISMADQLPIRFEDIIHIQPDKSGREREQVSEDVCLPVLEDIVQPDQPRLLISHRGQLVQEVELTAARTILGRSRDSDVVLRNRYVSGQHAMLVRSDDAVIIVDLKSRNGTYVNSNAVKSRVLRNDDIVSLGDYRLKIEFSAECQQWVGMDFAAADTSMTLEDARRARKARKSGLATVDSESPARSGKI